MTVVRPMTADDIPHVMAVVRRASEAAERRAGREPEPPTPVQVDRTRREMERFVERDPGGAWVAVENRAVVGMAEAIRRGPFWGLAMLFVDPGMQGAGVGRRLLDATLSYADGADVRMIMTSLDPRALRRYALAGLRIHPAVEAEGTVDRGALPSGLGGRAGDAGDLDLVADVDARLRGSRAEDVAFMLGQGDRMHVIDDGSRRGYVVFASDRLRMLGATDDGTAARLLWSALAGADSTFSIGGLTAGQDWAVRVALAARLQVVPSGPLFVGGLDRPPGPWIPSGWYF